MTTASRYLTQSREFLTQARVELARGDLPQASEKGWGAAAQMVKAIAEQRGWEHQSHASLFNVVARLVDETGNHNVGSLFRSANSLHVNFYENWQNAETVGGGIDDTERLMDLLGPILR